MGFFAKNQMFFTVLMAWLIAQTIKAAIGVVQEKRFIFKWFVGSGGMPSSHAATVSALATAVGLTYGFASPLFAITFRSEERRVGKEC